MTTFTKYFIVLLLLVTSYIIDSFSKGEFYSCYKNHKWPLSAMLFSSMWK